MEPTLTSNDVIVCEHITTRMLRFNYGDIVISKSPTRPDLYVCKRITGLPGDRISHKDYKIVRTNLPSSTKPPCAQTETVFHSSSIRYQQDTSGWKEITVIVPWILTNTGQFPKA